MVSCYAGAGDAGLLGVRVPRTARRSPYEATAQTGWLEAVQAGVAAPVLAPGSGRNRSSRTRLLSLPLAVLTAGLSVGLVEPAAAQSPGIELSPAALEVAEGGSGSYTVKLATQPSADVQVSIGGTAGTDLTVDNRSLTFTSTTWSAPQTVVVSAGADQDATDDSETLTHTASGGDYGSITRNLRVTVEDTTGVTMSFRGLATSILEYDGQVTMSASIDKPLSDALTVTVTAVPDTTATLTTHYNLTGTELTIPAGQTVSSNTLTLAAVDNFIRNSASRRVLLTAAVVHAQVTNSQLTATVGINDDDYTSIVLYVTPERIFETGGVATVTARLNRLVDHTVTVQVSLDPVAPAMPGDVTLGGLTTLTFLPGAYQRSVQRVTITAVDNATDAPDKTVRVVGTVIEGHGVAAPAPRELTIVDDDSAVDPPTVALRLSPNLLREGFVDVSTVTAEASRPLTEELQITVSAEPAHEDTTTDHFTLGTYRVLTIPVGGTQSTGTVTVTAVDDEFAVPGLKRVRVSGTVPAGSSIAAPLPQDLTIRNEDPRVEVILEATPAAIDEGEVSTITARSRTPVPEDLTLTVTAADEPYYNFSENVQLMIAKGQTASTGVVTITAVDDEVYSTSIRVVRLSVDRSSLPGYVLNVRSVNLLIADDDRPSALLSVLAAPTLIYEDNRVATIRAVLNDALTEDVTVTVSVDEGSTTALPEDYVLSANRTLTIAQGQTASTGTVTLTSVDDDFYGPSFTVSVSFDLAVTGIAASAVAKSGGVTIRDNEPYPVATLILAPEDATEAGGQTTVTAELSSALLGTTEFTVSTEALGATRPGDFTQVGTTLTIAPGSKTSTGEVTLTAIDNEVDSADRAVRVEASLVVTGEQPSSPVRFPFRELWTITDDETLGLVLSPLLLNVAEGGNGTYTVKLASEPTVTVTVAIGGTTGTDLTLDESILTFTTSTWNTAQTVTVTAGRDDDATDDTATLTHTASGGDYGSITSNLPVTVEDTTDVTMRLYASTASMPEYEGQAIISARIDKPLNDALTVTVTAVPNTTATLPADYNLSGPELTIPAGQTASSDTLTLSAVDNFITNPDRREVLLTAAVVHDQVPISQATAKVRINDDDFTSIVLDVTPERIFENGGVATVTARLNFLVRHTVTLQVSLDPVAPAMPGDVTLGGLTTLTFPPGSYQRSVQRVTITAVDNATDAPDKTVRVVGTVIEGHGVEAPAPRELTIVDDDSAVDPPTVALRLSPNTLREGFVDVSTVSAEASRPLTEELQITVSAEPADEDTTTDHFTLSTNRVLTIPAGGTQSTGGTVTVTAVDDDFAVPSLKRVRVSGTVPAGSSIAAPLPQDLTIRNEDDRVDVILEATPGAIDEGGVSTITARSRTPVPADTTLTASAGESEYYTLSDNLQLMIAQGQTASTGVVTLTAVDDEVPGGIRSVRLSLDRDSLPSYVRNVLSPTLLIADDDRPSAVLSVLAAPKIIYEDNQVATIRAVLSETLSEDVTVTVSVDEGDSNTTALPEDYVLSANRTLTIPKGATASTGTVTLTSVDDDFYGPNFHVSVYFDLEATGIAASAVVNSGGVTIRDDESTPRATLILVPEDATEAGGQTKVTAELNSALVGTTEFTVSSEALGATRPGDFTQTGATLTIAPGSKTSTGEVTLTAIDNEVDSADRAVRVEASLVVTGEQPSYPVRFPFRKLWTITDDDTAGIVLSESSLNLAEGGTESYTVTLASEPTATVTVAIGGTTGTDLTLDESILTFTTSTWDTAQTVTVTAGEDADATNDMATLTHTASGGDYGAETADLPVTVDDNGTASQTVTLSVSPSSVDEDAAATTVTVTGTLDEAPLTSDTGVTVSVGASGDAATEGLDYAAVNDFTLTIDAGETFGMASFTLSPINDAIDEVDNETLSVSGTTTATSLSVVSTAVAIEDDETESQGTGRGITVSPTGMSVPEGESVTYTVVLSSEPTAPVTVAIGGTTGTDLTLDTSSLTFTASTWNTAQTVTVTAGEDADATNDTATLTHTGSGGDYGSETKDLPVTVVDDETLGLVLSKMSLNPTEGSTESYTVKLASEPTATVTVTIGGTAGTDLTLDTASLTFTTSTWNTAQTVTVTAGEDADATDDTATLTHTASGGDYGAETADLPVTVADDTTVGLVLSKPSLNPTEGSTESYTVKLSSEPTAPVTVTIAGTTGTDLTLDTSSLTFTTSTWDTAQTVTVTAGEDADATDDTATLTHTASGGDYGAETKDLPVTVDDDTTLGLVLSKPSLNPTEGGNESYTVKLASEPTATVTVTIGGTAGTDLTLDTSSLTFTTSTWDTAQTVTVTAGEDADATDDTSTLTHTASGGDYGSETKDLPVTVVDDETLGLVLSKMSLNPTEGSTESYTVKLASEPTGTVTVAIGGTAGTDLTLDTSSLTFTTSTWDTAQTVTVTAGEDADATDDTSTLTHTASGGDYGSETKDLPVTVVDDTTLGLVLSTPSLNVAEGGNGSYTVKLASEPTGTVTVAIGGTAGTDLTLDTSSLTFTTSTWDTAQTVTVTAGEDADATDDTSTLTHTASGGDYGSETKDLPVTVVDDTTLGLVLSTPSLNVAEGGNESYTVKLASEPTAPVTVVIGGTAGTDLTLDTSSLTFTTSTWDTAQTVTVTAGEDDDATHDTATLTHTASGGDYGAETKDLHVTVVDDTTLGLVLSKTSLNVAEGGNGSYTVKLASEPTVTVTVAIAGTAGTDLTLDTSSLTFTTSTWASAQTVTVTAGEDADATDDTATLTHTASGGDYGAETADLPVTVDDDTTVGLVLSKTSLNPTEGGNESYTVKLSSQPTGTVTVAIGGTTGTDLTLDTSSLTFTASTWASAQTVTVTAGEDADATDDTATLTHTASGGDYGSETKDLPVTVDDDTTVGLVLSKTSLNPTEGGTESYTVKLASEPTATVTVVIAGTTGTDLTLDTSSLTFTTSTWASAQTVTVTAGEDADATDDTATLTHTASGGDYGSETADLPVTVDDDTTLGLVLSKSSLNPTEGGNESYTVKLASEPTATVTVAIGGTAGTDLTLDTSSLTFTTSTWDTAQTVRVTAGEDADATDDTATLTHTASGGDYGSKTADLPVTVVDDTTLGLVLSKPSLNPTEGSTESYTVKLASEPTATVTVTIGGTAGTDLTLDTSSLTFTTSTWASAQTVTVTAGEDADATDDTATLTHTASGGDYGSKTVDLPVTITDNDTAATGVILTLDPQSVDEDAGATPVTVTVALDGVVRAEATVVTVSVSAGTADADDFEAAPATFEVTIAEGATSATGTFTLTPTDDELAEGPETLSVTGTTDVSVGLPVTAAELTLVDDDAVLADLMLSVAPKEVMEDAGPAEVHVRVTLAGGVRTKMTMVTVTVDDGEDDYAAVPAMFEMEILAGETSAEETFMLTPVPDTKDESDQDVLITGTNGPEGLLVRGTVLVIRDDDESNEPPKFEQERYTFDLPENRSGREAVVVLGTVGARDSDGDQMRYALFNGDRDRFTVSRGSGTVSYIGEGEDFEAGPSEFELQVTAKDSQFEAKADVVVRVVDLPEAPEAADDRAETPEDVPKVIDVLVNDTDPDGGRLRVSSAGAPEHGTATLVSGGGVRYAPSLNWHGEDRFTYTVVDPGGLTATATVQVTVTPVNDRPEAVDDEAETLEDVPAVVDVLANDTDGDGDPLEIVSVGSAGHGATSIAGRGVRYAPALNWYGTDRFTYTIADPAGLTSTATVTMTVHPANDAPEAVGVIPDQALEEGGAEVTVDLTPYFTDVDGDVLTYEAVSSDETAVTATVSGATLALSAVVTGTAMVMVTASDVEGLMATQTFGVTVGDRLVRAVMTDTLAALGRGHLSSARQTIGRRLETGGGGMTRMMVAGQQLSLDAWDRMGAGGLEQTHEWLFRAATLQQRPSATDLVGTSADPGLRRSAAGGLMGGGLGGPGGGRDRLLQGTDVLLSFGGRDGPAVAGSDRWTVWGQGDLQSFRGVSTETSSYDGDLRTGYLGMDVRLSERWLAGVAVARSGGTGNWEVGSSSGRLATELTVLHPYVRWGGRESAVWALAGVGWGTAQNERTLTARRGTSGLSLALGLVEGRRRLATLAGGLELDLRGEASSARLRTGDGEETVDGLEASVRRVRTGVEVTLPLGGPGGLQVAPFGAVSTRHDGGAGQTGVGLEVAGGVRATGGRVRVEAQGRMLVLHTATDYEERGVSVTASVGGGQYEPGLTASVRPRWGAPGSGAESLWQDQIQSYAQGAARDDAGVDARVGYGLRLPGGRLLTPFGGYAQVGGGCKWAPTWACWACSAATSAARCRSSSWGNATAGRAAGRPTTASRCSES